MCLYTCTIFYLFTSLFAYSPLPIHTKYTLHHWDTFAALRVCSFLFDFQQCSGREDQTSFCTII